MQKIKAVFNWSGGKDSAFALFKALQSGQFEIVALLTTVNSEKLKSTMHDIPLELLQRQADAIGIPLYIVGLKPKGGMKDYGDAMSAAVEHFKGEGVTHFIFGDIFLHDVRSYREKALAPCGIEVVEPLWDMTTDEVMEGFLASGLKSVVVTTTASVLGREYVGRVLDHEFVESLPEGADVCGENGEYHTFCYDGPIFRQPVKFSLSEPFMQTFPIGMDDGEMHDFSYWFAGLDV